MASAERESIMEVWGGGHSGVRTQEVPIAFECQKEVAKLPSIRLAFQEIVTDSLPAHF